jgi:hypothetical protein
LGVSYTVLAGACTCRTGGTSTVLRRRVAIQFSEACWFFLQGAMGRSPAAPMPDAVRSALQAAPVIGRRTSSRELCLRIEMTRGDLYDLSGWLTATLNTLPAGDSRGELCRLCLAVALARLCG